MKNALAFFGKYIQENRFIIFLGVGALNTVFGYSIFAILIYIKIHYTFAYFLATCIGILFNFNTTGKLVFNNKDNTKIFRFICTYAVTCICGIALIKAVSGFISNLYISGAISTAITAVISYNLSKHFVFCKKTP